MNKEEFKAHKEKKVADLNIIIQAYEKQIAAVRSEIAVLECDIRNFIFDSIDEALGTIEEDMREEASEACEGSYNTGNTEYEQEFIVNGIKYLAKAEVEYNRHDKRYYYVDGFKMSYSEIGPYVA